MVTQTHTETKNLPVLGGIVNAFETATVRITDLVINTATKTYGVGLALDFTHLHAAPAAVRHHARVPRLQASRR